MAVQSTAMAGQNLLLAAHALGLGACWMCAPCFHQRLYVKHWNYQLIGNHKHLSLLVILLKHVKDTSATQFLRFVLGLIYKTLREQGVTGISNGRSIAHPPPFLL